MSSNLQALFRAKDLLYMLTWRDIHVRYKQSIMGLFWSILMRLWQLSFRPCPTSSGWIS